MDSMPKYIHLDNWIFEVKAVRALRVNDYGEPYSAIANINFNGDMAYVDGLMTKENDAFSRHDFQTFKDFCRQLQVKEMHYDRYKNQQLKSESVLIQPQKAQTILQLVK
ncbi:hypothetical protein AADZ91_05590 [Colwelliaceae bacterium 6441]